MDIKCLARPLAVKALAADGLFSGYASVFDLVDQQNEIVAPGAFERTLRKWRARGRMPALLWMHDPAQPIGLWLDLSEDDKGLAVQGRLALRTQQGLEAYELLKMGALTGMSIGYRVVASRVDAARKARILTEVDLFEISLVTFPANDAARVSDVKAPPASCAAPGAAARASSRPKNDRDATRALVARLHQAARKLQQHPQRRV